MLLKYKLIFFTGLLVFFLGFLVPVLTSIGICFSNEKASSDTLISNQIDSPESKNIAPSFLKYVHDFKFHEALDAWKKFRTQGPTIASGPLFFEASQYFSDSHKDFGGPDPFKKKSFKKYVETGLISFIKSSDYKDMLFNDLKINLKKINNTLQQEKGGSKEVIQIVSLARLLFVSGYFSESRDLFNRLVSENNSTITSDDMRMFAMARRIDHYLANALANAQIILARENYSELKYLYESCVYFSRVSLWPDYFMACSSYDQQDYIRALYHIEKMDALKKGYSNIRIFTMAIDIYIKKSSYEKALSLLNMGFKEYYMDIMMALQNNLDRMHTRTLILKFCKEHNVRLDDIEKLLYFKVSCLYSADTKPQKMDSINQYECFISLFDDMSSFFYIKDVALIKGNYLYGKKDYEGALKAYNRAAEFNAFPAEYIFNRAKCNLKIGNNESGLADLITASATEIDSQVVRNMAAIELMDSGSDLFNPEAALNHALKACDYSKYKDYNCLLTLSMAYYKNNDIEKARKIYKKAQSLNNNEKASNFLKKLLYKKGE